jgi:hypothetical protein
MNMKQLMTSRSVLMAASFGLVLGSAACGDDGGSDSSTPQQKPDLRKKAPAAAPAAAPGGAGNVGLTGYSKVDEELRHQINEIDFVPDVSGETNRDPFRSWLNRVIDNPTGPITVDVCTEGNVRWGAPTYSIRDLNLIGLVKRGRSFAQFTDKSEADSWIVRKGDCIGQEKAIVEEVGVGYVRLSITPPAPPGSPAPPAQKQNIPLHPDELEIPDEVLGEPDDV